VDDRVVIEAKRRIEAARRFNSEILDLGDLGLAELPRSWEICRPTETCTWP
jgi:hypothetical protein